MMANIGQHYTISKIFWFAIGTKLLKVFVICVLKTFTKCISISGVLIQL